MRRVWPIILGCLMVSGCGVPVSDQDVLPEPVLEEPATQTSLYENSRYGYAFWVPDDHVVYGLGQAQTAIEATAESDVVFLVEDETNLFTVRSIENERSAHEWVTENLRFFYPTGDAAQRVGEVAGQTAIVLSGSGTMTSPARVVVFPLGDALTVISYDRSSETYEAILDSFVQVAY